MFIDIVRLSTLGCKERASLFNSLDKKSSQSINKNSDYNGRLRSAVGVNLIKNGINKYYGIIEPILSKNGKPYIKSNKCFFNVSHSGDYVVCVFDKIPIGVDVEFCRDVNFDIAKRLFSRKEKEYLNSSFDRCEAFFTIWTMKEAYCKMTGKGLKGINQFSCDFLGGEVVKAYNDCVFEIIKEDNYIISVCSRLY